MKGRRFSSGRVGGAQPAQKVLGGLEQLRAGPAQFGAVLARQSGQDVGPVRGDGHEHAAAIGGIGLAGDQAALGGAVDQLNGGVVADL
jgi:hypothetical protein